MILRVGKVTNTYPDEGKVKVLYKDRNEASMPLPVLTFNDEYKMPPVGASVLTLHMQNGSSKGFVLGTFWNGNKQPTETGTGVYHKSFGGSAYAKYANNSFKIYSPELLLQSSAGGVSVETLIALLNRVTELENAVSELKAKLGE